MPPAARTASKSGFSCGQVGRRESRRRCSTDLSRRRASAMSVVSGVARSTTPVLFVATASTKNRSRSSKCSNRNGPVGSLAVQQAADGAADHPIELAAHRRCYPHDQARRPAGGHQRLGLPVEPRAGPAAATHRSIGHLHAAAVWATCTSPLIPGAARRGGLDRGEVRPPHHSVSASCCSIGSPSEPAHEVDVGMQVLVRVGRRFR